MVNEAQLSLESEHIKHQIDLLRLSEDANRKIRPILTGLQRELLAEIAMQDLSAYRTQRLNHLLSFANSAIEATYSDINSTIEDFNVGVAEFENEFSPAAMQRAVGIELGNVLTASQLSAIAQDTAFLGGPASEFWGRQAVRLQQQFQDQMRIGFLEGDGSQALGRRVRQIMDTSRREAETLARTAVQGVANAVRDELIQDNKSLVQGYIHTSTLDNRTSLVCIERDQLKWNINKEPVGHNKPFRRPPLHYNAVKAGEMVETENGPKKIESVSVGERVYTHKGRLNPVYAVMSKPCESGFIRVIKLDSGRTIRVTDEHPVLSVGHGWVRADEIEIGDQLFQHTKEPVVFDDRSPVVMAQPDDYPSSFDAGEVFDCVTTDPGSMASSINLDDNLMPRHGEVSNRLSVDKLANINNSSGIKKVSEEPFNRVVDLDLPFGLRFKILSLYRFIVDWVVFFHALGVRGINWMCLLCKSICPMILTTAKSLCLGLLHRHSRRFSLTSNLNTVPFAPIGNNRLADSETALNGPNGFTTFPMSLFDKVREFFSTSKVNHFKTPVVVDIKIVPYTGTVVNLAVKDDETYLVDNIVVHNCRSIMVPWLKSFKDLSANIQDDIDPGVRASMNGSVPQSLSYNKWLKTQPQSVQIEVLGRNRYELWKKDRLSLRQLTNQQGRPLTLEQLRERGV